MPECADMNIKESTQTTKLNQKVSAYRCLHCTHLKDTDTCRSCSVSRQIPSRAPCSPGRVSVPIHCLCLRLATRARADSVRDQSCRQEAGEGREQVKSKLAGLFSKEPKTFSHEERSVLSVSGHVPSVHSDGPQHVYMSTHTSSSCTLHASMSTRACWAHRLLSRDCDSEGWRTGTRGAV